MRVDARLEGADLSQRREVEMAAPDEWPHRLEELGARRPVPGADPRLDIGQPLPGAPQPLVIGLGGERRDRDRHGAGVGAQAQVGAEDVAVPRALGEDGDEIARQAHEALLQRALVGSGQPVRVEQADEVNVRRIVELACAVLAKREDEIAGGARVGGLGRQLVARCGLGEEEGEGGLDGGVGEIGQRGGDGGERPEPAEIAERDEERRLRLGDPQARHENGAGGVVRRRGVFDEGAHKRVRVGVGVVAQPVGVFLGESREVWAVGGGADEEDVEGRVGLGDGIGDGTPAWIVSGRRCASGLRESGGPHGREPRTSGRANR